MNNHFSQEDYYEPEQWITTFQVDRQWKCAACSNKSSFLLSLIYQLFKLGNYDYIRNLPAVKNEFLQVCGEQIYIGDCFIHKCLLKKKFPKIEQMEKKQDIVRLTNLNSYSASNKLPQSTPLYQYSGSPVKVNLADELDMEVKGLMKNGSAYKGEFKIDFNYCNSVKNVQNISKFPQLIDQDEKKMVSASMFTFRITDKSNNIIYSQSPFPAQQKIPNDFSIEMMNQYKVFQTSSMHEDQRWVQVGQLETNPQTKTFKYSIPNKSDDQVVKNIEEFIKIRRQKLKTKEQDKIQSTLKNLFQCYQGYGKNKFQNVNELYPKFKNAKGIPTYIIPEIRQIYFNKQQQSNRLENSSKLINIYSQQLVPLDIIKNGQLYKRFYLLPTDFMIQTLKKYQNFTEIQDQIFTKIVQEYNQRINQLYEYYFKKTKRLQSLQLTCKSKQGNSCDQVRLDFVTAQFENQKKRDQFSFSTILMDEFQYSFFVRIYLTRQFQKITKFIFNEPDKSQINKALQNSVKLRQELREEDIKAGLKEKEMGEQQIKMLESIEWCKVQPYLGVWMPRAGLKIPLSRGKQLLLKEKEINQKYQERLIKTIQRKVQQFINKKGKEQINNFCKMYLQNKKRNQDLIKQTKRNLRQQFTLLSSNSKRIQRKLQDLFQVQQKIQLKIQNKKILDFIYNNIQNTTRSNSSSINVLITYQQNLTILSTKEGQLLRITNNLQIPQDKQKLIRFTSGIIRGAGLWDDIKNSPALMRQFLARNGIQNINIDYLFPDTIQLIKRRLSKQQIQNQQRLYAEQKKKEADQLLAQQQLAKYGLTRQAQLAKVQAKRSQNTAQSKYRFIQKANDVGESVMRGTNSSLSTNESNDDNDPISIKRQKWQNIQDNVKSRISQFENTIKQINPITNEIKKQMNDINKCINQLQVERNKKMAQIRPLNDKATLLQRKPKLNKQEKQALVSLMNQKRPLNFKIQDINNKIKQNQDLKRQTQAIERHLKSLQEISSLIQKYKTIQTQIKKSLVSLNNLSSETAKMTQNQKKLSQAFRNIKFSVGSLQEQLKNIQRKSRLLQPVNRKALQDKGISNQQINSLQQNYADLKEIFTLLVEGRGGYNIQASFDKNYARWRKLSQKANKK